MAARWRAAIALLVSPSGRLLDVLVGGLFDGCGLLAYGLHLAGFEHAWLCEIDEFRQGILGQRFPDVPVFSDVRAVEVGNAERVDLIAGGFPCKGISAAGYGEGFGHPETVLWREMHRIISDLRPRYVLVENVARLLTIKKGECFAEVIGGLVALGYDAEWDCFPASAFGAPHRRDRIFITATTANADRPRLERHRRSDCRARKGIAATGRVATVEWADYGPAIRQWETLTGRPAPQPLVRRVDDGRARRLVAPRLSALGDGVLVQAGWLCGRRIVEYEQQRLSSD